MKTVEWTDKAMADFQRTTRYIIAEFGRKAAGKFEQNITEWEALIVRNPAIGMKEPQLAHRPEGFRSIVISRQNKLVYYVQGETVYIAALWDTRREPRAQADNLK